MFSNKQPQNPINFTPATSNSVTPMMRQYQAIKQLHQEELLLFRLGDFYELFFEDAILAARLLNIVLTKRGKNGEQDVPMCGIPAHAADFYIGKLLKQGHSVAICEQLESPEEAKKRGHKAIVRREVVRILTPGTVLEENLLDGHAANYVSVISENRNDLTLAWADLSTGHFCVANIPLTSLAGELARIQPKELIIADKTTKNLDIIQQIHNYGGYLTRRPDSCFDFARCHGRICQFFKVSSIEGLADLTPAEVIACGALLEYVEHTQKSSAPLLQHIQQVRPEFFLQIDPATRASLELERGLDGGRNNSLLAVMDRTVTAGGARLMLDFLASPLTDIAAINERLDSVETLLRHSQVRVSLQNILKNLPDIERILGRISSGRAKFPDLLKMVDALQKSLCVAEIIANSDLIPRIKQAAKQITSFDGLMTELFRALRAPVEDDSMAEQAMPSSDETDNTDRATASKTKRDEAQFLGSGEAKLYIRPEYNPQLQRLYALEEGSREHINALRNKYRDLTGITSLKITKNNIIGWFIDVPPSQTGKMGNELFLHRQSLANSARYTTQELSQLEMELLLCQDKIKMLENQIFVELCNKIVEQAEQIILTAKNIAEIDIFCGLAELAETEGYIRPKLNNSQDFCIINGKHPVINHKMQNKFIANSCIMHEQEAAERNEQHSHKLWLITGPNMAGKSTFLRQNALLSIMAQMGSFIPAAKAEIGIVDKIFSRIGASDRIAQGQSTFMVEMLETAYIMRNATERSFLILDEIGRGTTTSDGLAIAWAIVEEIAQKIKARTLFATHYHELTQLDAQLPISCYNMKVAEDNGKIAFMHEVIPGKASNSYGIHVAEIAGMPQQLVQRAYEILEKIRK